MLIKVKAFPNSNKEEWTKKGAFFEIKIKEPPIRGMANKAIIRVLASIFQLPENKIRLVQGFRSRNKTFEI